MKLDKEFIELQKHIERLIKAGESDIARNHKKALDALRLYLAKLYAEHEIDGKLTFSEMSKYNRIDKVDRKIKETLSTLYKNNNKIIRGVLRGITIEGPLIQLNTLKVHHDKPRHLRIHHKLPQRRSS